MPAFPIPESLPHHLQISRGQIPAWSAIPDCPGGSTGTSHPFASLRAKGAPLRGGSLLWTTWAIRSADAKNGHLTTLQQIATDLERHRQSITLETDFCVEALQDAKNRHGQPEIFNTDQGVQFTSAAFLGELETLGVRISMDGKGRFLDNIFIERLWRSLKYEEVFIKAYGSVPEARIGIGEWLTFYNDERPHQALDYRTPTAVFHTAACNHVDNASTSLSRYQHDYRHNNNEKVLTNVA